jgi:hypothetical protein
MGAHLVFGMETCNYYYYYYYYGGPWVAYVAINAKQRDFPMARRIISANQHVAVV